MYRKAPTTLSGLIKEAIEADNKLQEFYLTNPQRKTFVYYGSTTKKANVVKPRQPYYGPMPIDLDNANKKRNYKKGPISPKERENRIKNNLYLYYSKPGHVINDCFAKKRRPFNKGTSRQFNIAEISTKSVA